MALGPCCSDVESGDAVACASDHGGRYPLGQDFSFWSVGVHDRDRVQKRRGVETKLVLAESA